MIVGIKKIDPEAKLPAYAHPGDAGMDLFALEETAVAPGAIVKVRTGIAFEIPVGYVGLVWDKSSVGINGGIKSVGGVLDAGYRGELFIGMANLSDKPYTFEKHHKVAQMLIQKVENPTLEEMTELSDTSRGTGGFGSTGK